MKANRDHCPLCSGPLHVKEVAPCMECGADPKELDHARNGKHTYAIYRIFGKFEVALCNFCQVDFSSYDPKYFGLPRKRNLGLGYDFEFVKDLKDVSIRKDKYCPACGLRLGFLRFVQSAREAHTNSDS